MNARLWTALLVVAAAGGAMLYVLTVGEPRLPVSVADGSYNNPSVGTVVLQNGLMTINNRRISYVIESDKVGTYVLPSTYVGASDHGFVIRSSGYPLKLRLDRDVRPSRLGLRDDVGGDPIVFARVNVN